MGSSDGRERLIGVWRRVLDLSWPVMFEQVFRTGMRTTDVIVTTAFSPAAVAAVGLADLYARLPLRIGLGLGGGAISLSSQDTGAAAGDDAAAARAAANRDEAVSGAITMGALAGVPFAVFGLLFGRAAIALLGAPPAVARQGGTYLAIIFATAPARHVALIAARSLQGTGDTRTPMYVNVVANLLNVVGSVVLGLGLFGAPRLAVLGVGLATAAGNVLTAAALVGALYGARTQADLTVPSDVTVARQLAVVSAPKVAEGLVATAAEFPFNALLLTFGTPVNAAYQIGRRLYQQVTGPLSRGYNVAANVVVGQSLGEDDPEGARFAGLAIVALGLATVGVLGIALAVAAGPLVGLLPGDRSSAAAAYAVGFARTYGLTAPFLVAFVVLSGSLQGAGETRVPFLARATGMFGCYLGVSYLVGVVLGYGVVGAYVGVATYYAWAATVAGGWFLYGGWAGRAARLLSDRGSVAGEE